MERLRALMIHLCLRKTALLYNLVRICAHAAAAARSCTPRPMFGEENRFSAAQLQLSLGQRVARLNFQGESRATRWHFILDFWVECLPTTSADLRPFVTPYLAARNLLNSHELHACQFSSPEARTAKVSKRQKKQTG
jgi:hypothetical protein